MNAQSLSVTSRRTHLGGSSRTPGCSPRDYFVGGAAIAATVLESLVMPVVLLVTLDIVLGDGISQVTGHSALYGSVPLIAMVGAMSGSMVGGIGLMRERTDGLLSRLWVLPVHRASGLLSRLAADGVRIVVTTAVILCAGLVMGFRFQQGFLASVAWRVCPDCVRVGVHSDCHHARAVCREHARGRGHRGHLGNADVLYQRLCAPRPVPTLDSASRPTSAGELCRRGDAWPVARGSRVGPGGRNAALVGRHCRRVRDTDGGRISTGQHAWMIAES